MVNFLDSLTLILAVMLFWIYLLWRLYLFHSMVLPQLLTFLQTQKGISLFVAQPVTILVLIATLFVNLKEMFHCRMSLTFSWRRPLSYRNRKSVDWFPYDNSLHHERVKLSASAASTEFCEWFYVGIDDCIPHRKYQAKPHSSSWFAPALGVVTEITSILYQESKSCESKVKFRQAVNCYKRVLETSKPACANKSKMGGTRILIIQVSLFQLVFVGLTWNSIIIM